MAKCSFLVTVLTKPEGNSFFLRLRTLVADLLPWGSGFDPRPIHMVFVVYQIALIQILSRIFRHNFASSQYHSHTLSVYSRDYITFASNSSIKNTTASSYQFFLEPLIVYELLKTGPVQRTEFPSLSLSLTHSLSLSLTLSLSLSLSLTHTHTQRIKITATKHIELLQGHDWLHQGSLTERQ
jgi:hypothetical protein